MERPMLRGCYTLSISRYSMTGKVAAEAVLDSLGAHLVEDQRDYYERAILASVRDQLDPKVWAAGRDIGVEAAIQLAEEDAGE
jgi:hypothetical protein